MEIHHKPKPWHGWREFLKEYGIIVLGVLTALAAEQAAEALHRHTQADEARHAIAAEVVTDVTRIHQRALANDCVAARLAQLEAIVDRTTPDGYIHGPSWVGRPPRYAVESARWDAASQSGRISLLPADWQGRFGFLYTALHHFYDLNNAEQEVWSKLEGLTGLDRLTLDGRLALKGDIAQARFYNGSLRQVADIIVRSAAAQGLHPTNRRDPPFGVCWPITTPTADGLARVEARWSGRPR